MKWIFQLIIVILFVIILCIVNITVFLWTFNLNKTYTYRELLEELRKWSKDIN